MLHIELLANIFLGTVSEVDISWVVEAIQPNNAGVQFLPESVLPGICARGSNGYVLGNREEQPGKHEGLLGCTQIFKYS